MINFDMSVLDGIVDDINKEETSKSGGNREFFGPGLVWQTNGSHRLRFLLDPEGKRSRHIVYHKFGKCKCLCPDFVRNNKLEGWESAPEKCKICEMARDIDNWRSGLGVKSAYLYYLYIVKSDAASDFWKLNELVVGLMKRKFHDSVNNWIKTNADTPEGKNYIMSVINPSVRGNEMIVTVTGGTQGSVQVAPNPIATFAIPDDQLKDGKKYMPLSKVYIEKFSMLDYDEALKLATEKYDELVSGKVVLEEDQQEGESKPADNQNTPVPSVSTTVPTISPNMTNESGTTSTAPAPAAGTQPNAPWEGQKPDASTVSVASAAPTKQSANGKTVSLANIPVNLHTCYAIDFAAKSECTSCTVANHCATARYA